MGIQTNYFKAWQKYTFIIAPKSRLILCNQIKKYLKFWKRQSRRKKILQNGDKVIARKNKLFQFKMSWIKWQIIYKYQSQIQKIKEFIHKKQREKLMKNVLKKWMNEIKKNK